MLNIAPNPFTEPLKKFTQDLRSTKWAFPYLLQIFHLLITISLILILGVFYLTIGFVSQISNSFWDVIVNNGDRMSFSNPIPSLFYAVSLVIYFLIFLPFFIIQSPFWLSGWITSKIGFKPFIILLITSVITIVIYFYRPSLPQELLGKMFSIQNSVKAEFLPSDTLNITTQDVSFSSEQ